jgi:hypothetical protein
MQYRPYKCYYIYKYICFGTGKKAFLNVKFEWHEFEILR